MAGTKPKLKLLTAWRQYLVIFSSLPAFLITLLFWNRKTVLVTLLAVWFIVFMLLYLVYLPARYKKTSFILKDESLIKTSGVFYYSSYCVPLKNIQYVTVLSSPVMKFNGLSSVAVVSAGGRVIIPGFVSSEAEAFAGIIYNSKG